MTAELLHAFELLLMRRHRFALSDLVVNVRRVVRDLCELQRVLTVAALSCDESDALQEPLGRISRQLERLVAVSPTFTAEQELAAFMNGLQEFGRLSETLQMELSDARVKTLQREMEALKEDATRLREAVAASGDVCRLLGKKRDYLARFLEEAGQVLENSNSRRVAQYENAIEQFTEEFKVALEDKHLQRVKQLRFGIQMIETSMSTMLLPHFEICRTITTANAQVTASSFLRVECDDIDAFVRTAAKLKGGEVTFRSVLQDADKFLAQLALFEQAASKDSFLVLSSALKLQFRESLDQELFLAYVDDWNAKRKAMQSTETSNEYRAATTRLQDLKTAIGRAHELVQTSKEKMVLDDPKRTALVQEVTRIFDEEGGTIVPQDVLV